MKSVLLFILISFSMLDAQVIELNPALGELELSKNNLKILEEIAAKLEQDENYDNTPCIVTLFVGDKNRRKIGAVRFITASTGRDVYRVDLSRVISKYIDETEENLEKVFTEAEIHDWILFFDEADELFGRRKAKSENNNNLMKLFNKLLFERVRHYSGLIIFSIDNAAKPIESWKERFDYILEFKEPDDN